MQDGLTHSIVKTLAGSLIKVSQPCDLIEGRKVKRVGQKRLETSTAHFEPTEPNNRNSHVPKD